jgi:hypothetical protein
MEPSRVVRAANSGGRLPNDRARNGTHMRVATANALQPTVIARAVYRCNDKLHTAVAARTNLRQRAAALTKA